MCPRFWNTQRHVWTALPYFRSGRVEKTFWRTWYAAEYTDNNIQVSKFYNIPQYGGFFVFLVMSQVVLSKSSICDVTKNTRCTGRPVCQIIFHTDDDNDMDMEPQSVKTVPIWVRSIFAYFESYLTHLILLCAQEDNHYHRLFYVQFIISLQSSMRLSCSIYLYDTTSSSQEKFT